MSKTVTVEINGTAWHMPVSYAASRDIAESVADPLAMAVKSYQTGSMDLTTEQIIDIIAIGVRHAGCSLVRDAIGDAVVQGGVINFMQVVGEYIGALVSGGPEKQAAASKKKPTPRAG